MKIAFEIKDGRAIVERCYSYGTEAEIPEELEGYPVSELAPYAFSAHMDPDRLRQGWENQRLRLWDTDLGCWEAAVSGRTPEEEIPVLAGERIERICLPSSMKKIGAYAFYNCSALGELCFSGGLSDLGAGLFTGCHGIRRLRLQLDGTEVSCLREMLLEIPEKLTVFVEGKRQARLVFPEFFEESVENTPARILMIQMHGSGMNFRNCFYDRRLDFRAYDACFFRARAEEDLDTVMEMVLSRLRYPAGLADERKREYEAWLSEHLEQSLEKAVEEREMELLSWLASFAEKQKKEVLTKAASWAAARDFPEGAAFLMDMLHRQTGTWDRRFEL